MNARTNTYGRSSLRSTPDYAAAASLLDRAPQPYSVLPASAVRAACLPGRTLALATGGRVATRPRLERRGQGGPMKTWIAVADGAHARIFEQRRPARPWKLLDTLEHPESRMKEAEVYADAPGTGFGHGGMRSAMSFASTAKESEKCAFAREIARRLEAGAVNDDYERLVLVAPPHFLGLLRKYLAPNTELRLDVTVNKDLTMLKDRDLPSSLADVL